MNYNDEMMQFNVSWPIKRSAIKAGMNLMEEDEPEDVCFRSTFAVEFVRYEDFYGSVIVESVTSKAITLKFDDFSFTRGNQPHTVNGTATYSIE